MYLGLVVPTEGGACVVAPDTYVPPAPVITPTSAPAPVSTLPAIALQVTPAAGTPTPAQPTPTYLPYGTPVTLADGTPAYADGNGGTIAGATPVVAPAVSTAPSVALVAPTPDTTAAPAAPASPATALPMGGLSTNAVLLIGGALALYLLSRKGKRT